MEHYCSVSCVAVAVQVCGDSEFAGVYRWCFTVIADQRGEARIT
jgi:hypothetical protein